jgi:hypothetical protein
MTARSRAAKQAVPYAIPHIRATRWEANEMAVTALEYMETNKERLKPVMDFLEPAIDSLLPPKVKTGPGESKDPPGTPSH